VVTSGALVVDDLQVDYETARAAVPAVRGVSFTVAAGEFFTLLGSSGCGKTTILRAIAGLESPQRGRITIGGRPVYSSFERVAEPPHRRDIGMVFQSYAIWPHLTVFENVAFPLTAGRRRLPRAEVRQRTQRALSLVHLGALADRPAPLLSGGQQQRVALARALVAEPSLLLLDEPLSNLDAKLRTAMRLEIKHLVKSLGLTTLYVTHDQLEALTMSDRIAVMRDGVFVEVATPRDLYLHPRTSFAATFLGETNLIEGTLEGRRGDAWMVRTNVGTLACAVNGHDDPPRELAVVCRPEATHVSASPPGGDNVVPGQVAAAVFGGDQVMYCVEVGDRVFQARGDAESAVREGDRVYLHLPPDRCRLVRRE
jgi:iron(III) transport system ATP-binding protein